MLVFLIIAAVLIGLAYADYCLIDNTAHFGICFQKVAEAEEVREVKVEVQTEAVASLWKSLADQAEPVSGPLLRVETEPVLEMSEAS